MRDFHVTKFWGQEPTDLIGKLSLSEEAVEIIKRNPATYQFAISFIEEPNENGTYDKVKLLEVSLIDVRKVRHDSF